MAKLMEKKLLYQMLALQLMLLLLQNQTKE
jgi:hypothetical protein